MANPSQEEIRDVLNAQEPASRNFKQTFQFANRTVTHSHHLQVQVTSEKNQKIEILNHFATAKDQKITKLTQIHFQNRIIKIFDSFSYDNSHLGNNVTNSAQAETVASQTDSTRNTIKTKHKGAQEQTSNQQIKLRDTKNLVKNIIKLFQIWVQTNQTDKKMVQQSLSKIFIKEKYNNRLISYISKDQVLRKSFIDFAERSGQEFIHKSKIVDKQSHLEALKRYRRMCSDEECRFLKKQTAKLNEKQRSIQVDPQ